MKELHEFGFTAQDWDNKSPLLGILLTHNDVNFIVRIVDKDSKMLMRVEFIPDMYNGYPMRLDSVVYNHSIDEDAIKHCMQIIENAITDYISSNEMKFNPDWTHIQTTKFFYAKLNKNLSYKCLEWFTSLKKEDEYIFYQ